MQWMIQHAILIFTFVTTFATLVYGVATLLLWHESRQGRVRGEANAKLSELHTAFYDAWGNWHGYRTHPLDSQATQVYESFIRLEGQLRLNGHEKGANNLGRAVIEWDQDGIGKQLAEVGVALGLVSAAYKRALGDDGDN